MEDFMKRFQEFLDKQAGGLQSFIQKTGIANTTIQSQLTTSKNGISLKVVGAALSHYPELSAEWLLRGEGEMLISDNLPPITGVEDDNVMELHAKITKQAAEIEKLRILNIKLQAQLEYLEEYHTRLILKLK